MASKALTKSSSGRLPPVQFSFLERAGRVAEAFDAPGNFTRSLLAGEFQNALDILNPLERGRRISGSELTGRNLGFFSELGVELVTDPLLFVSGIGALSKSGKAIKGITSAGRQLSALRGIEKVAVRSPGIDKLRRLLATAPTHERGALRKSIKALEKPTFDRQKTINELEGFIRVHASDVVNEPSRSVVKLGLPFVKGGIELGDFKTVSKVAGAIRVLPDIRIAPILKNLDKLKGKQFKIKTSGKLGSERTSKLMQVKIDQLENEVVELSKGVIPQETANKLQKTRQRTADFFRRFARSPGQRTIKDLELNTIAAGKFDIDEELTDFAGRLGELRKKSDLTTQAFNDRFLRIGEFRHFGTHPELLPEVNELLLKDLQQFTKKYTSKLKGSRFAFVPSKFLRILESGDINKAESAFRAANARRLEKTATTLNKLDGVPKAFQEQIDKTQKLFEGMESDLFQIKKRAETRRLQLAFGEDIIKNADPNELKLANDYFEPLERFIDVAKPLGVDIEKLQSSSGFLSFVPRILSKEGRALKKKNLTLFRRVQNDATISLSGSHQRRLYPEFDIPKINKTLREEHKIDFDFFDNDPVNLIRSRRREHVTALTRAQTAHVLVNSFGAAEKFPGSIKASAYFKRIGLKAEAAPNKFLPRDVLEDALRTDEFFRKEFSKGGFGLLGSIMDIIAITNKPFQIGLTGPFPAFHHRNAFNNMFINFIGGVSNPLEYKEMYRLQRLRAKGLLKGDDIVKWKQLVEFRVVGAGQLEEFVAKNLKVQAVIERPIAGTIDILKGRIGEDALKPLARRAEELDFIPGFGRAYGKFLEENARGAHFLSKLKDGLSPLDAARSVNKYLFDPKALGVAEEKLLKPTILFYTWLRNNIPLMIQTSIENPRTLAVLSKLIGRDENDAPGYLRGGFSISAPIFGKGEFIGSLGLGVEDLFRFNVGDADPSGFPLGSADQIRRLFEKQATALAPLPRVMMEFIQGKTFFSRRKFEDSTILQIVSQALPTSRLTGTVSELLDEDRTFTSKMVATLTGLRLHNVDPGVARRSLARRKALSTGLVSRFPILVPKNREDKKGRELIRLLNKKLRE